jgi:hypothetical protein
LLHNILVLLLAFFFLVLLFLGLLFVGVEVDALLGLHVVAVFYAPAVFVEGLLFDDVLALNQQILDRLIRQLLRRDIPNNRILEHRRRIFPPLPKHDLLLPKKITRTELRDLKIRDFACTFWTS